jgi:hypothetical protein
MIQTRISDYHEIWQILVDASRIRDHVDEIAVCACHDEIVFDAAFLVREHGQGALIRGKTGHVRGGQRFDERFSQGELSMHENEIRREGEMKRIIASENANFCDLKAFSIRIIILACYCNLIYPDRFLPSTPCNTIRDKDSQPSLIPSVPIFAGDIRL